MAVKLFRRRLARVALWALLFPAALVALAACGPEPTPPPEPVTITFDSPNADAEGHEALVEAFNGEHPWVTVELRRSMSGQADVFVAPAYLVGVLRDEGAIVSLDPYIERDNTFDLADYHPAAVRHVQADGRTWAVPYGIDPIVLYYNADLFAAYGVQPPDGAWNWEEFLAAAKALRDERAGTFGYVSADHMLSALAFIYQHGGWILDDLEHPTRPTLGDPRVIEAVDWYAGLIHHHNVAPTAEQLRMEPFQGTAAVGVYAGKVGMWMGFFSERGGAGTATNWPGKWPMRWGMAPLPQDARAGTIAIVQGYVISASAKSPDACWEWISYLSKQPTSGAIPARRSLLEGKTYERLVGEADAALARRAMGDAELLSPQLSGFLPAFERFSQAMYRIVNGSATAEEALTAAQRSLDGR
ncbi:MAG: extracellular solute-binding protein [Chloroflexi bacterium]|nr:extracellular solute-binding protein [Chloroflexota bacterium]